MTPARRRVGRPPHAPTDDTRARLARMIAAGATVPEVAAALGISAPTLRAHYRAELAAARPQKNIPLPEFDDPAPPGPGRPGAGRPEHLPTDESRERVEILLAAGMPHWQVAQALEIAESTLQRHYAAELDAGRAKRRAQVIEAMFRAATAGNVAAQKAYLGRDQDLDAPPPDRPERPATLGKKEAADMAARTAGDGVDWARHLPH